MINDYREVKKRFLKELRKYLIIIKKKKKKNDLIKNILLVFFFYNINYNIQIKGKPGCFKFLFGENIILFSVKKKEQIVS